MQAFKNIEKGQVQYYINKMNKGDIEARKKVIYHYSNLVLKIIDKDFNDKKYCKEDLFQAGIIGLLKVLNNCSMYNPYVLSARMNTTIHQEIKKYINNENKYNSYKYKNTTEQITDNFIELYEKIEDSTIILEAIKSLEKREQEIICLYFFKNMKQKDIAKKCSITTSRTQQILKTGLTQIKDYLDESNKLNKNNWIFNETNSENIKKEKIKPTPTNKSNEPIIQISKKSKQSYQNIINYYTNYIIDILETNYQDSNRNDLIETIIFRLLNIIVENDNKKKEETLINIKKYINDKIDAANNKSKK